MINFLRLFLFSIKCGCPNHVPRSAWFVGAIFILSSYVAHGQQVIQGTVTSAVGEALPGVNVVIKNTTIGTVTDIDGNYSITVSQPDPVLVFSFIGYVTREVAVNNRSTINVVLEEDIEQLDEVVVIGYGTVRKSDLTGAVSTVKSEELVKIPSNNPMQALQGKVAGVQVNSISGAPGENVVVRVRGTGTFNNASPIYVVDGVILNDISFLNAADIQSMEVLKDASATAIYGSRGANGVIMVTTKQGQLGQGTTFTYNGEYSIQQVANKIDLLNGREFATIYNEIIPGTFNNIDALPNTDWQDLIFQTAALHNHQVSATGASDRTQYYVGIGYYNQEGIIDKSRYERLSIKLNNTYHLSDAIKLGNNINLTPFKQQVAPGVTYAAYRAQPIEAPYLPNGDFAGVNAVGNPLADLAYSNNYNKGFRSVGNIFAEVGFLQDFTFRSSYGIDFLMNKSTNFTPAYTVFFPNGDPSNQKNTYSSLTKGTTDNFSWLWENTISFFREADQHKIDAVVGYTMQESRSELMELYGQNLLRDNEDFWYIQPGNIYDESKNIDNVSRINNSVDANLFYSMISYLARVNYTFDNRYIFTATFRRDGSSKFSSAKRYAHFPSFAVGWNIINEEFMRDVNWLTNLKLRASWGKIGNEKIRYTSRFSNIQTGLNVVLGEEEAAIPGASFGVTGNPDLKWETTTQTDIGLELGLLQNRLNVELDYYRRVTDDILVELAIPGYLGNGVGARMYVNAGSVLNRGIEFNVNWNDQINDDWSYSIGARGSTLHNEVLSIGGTAGVDSTLVGGNLSGRNVTLSRKGLPIGAFYGYKTDGIFQNQGELDSYPHLPNAGVGDLRFVDVNNDGQLNDADRTYIGSPIPTFIYGFDFSLAYSNFDLSLDFQGQLGNKIFNGKEVVRPDPYNFEQRVWDRWTGEGTSTTIPRPSFGDYNYNLSDYFIQNGSFLRLRNIALGYSLPERVAERIRLDQVRVFVRVTNLFTWTEFTGYSPEIVSDNVIDNGIDRGGYPIPTIYSVGLNLNF